MIFAIGVKWEKQGVFCLFYAVFSILRHILIDFIEDK